MVSPDGLTIYFRSDRTGEPFAGFNIFVATRPSIGGTFGPASIVPNINTNDDDGPSWLSADGCRLYISSYVGGNNDIFVATRPLP